MTSFILARTARRTWRKFFQPLTALGALGLCLGGGTSHAAAFQVEAPTEAQAYQIRAWRGTTPEDPVLLPRRRIVQYLGLNAFELVTGQDVGFESTTPVAGGTVAPDGTLRITFSETMDPSTLRPGIAVFAGRDEVALTLTAPAVPELEEDVERGDVPYTVEATAAEGSALQPGTSYTLVLRDSLLDLEGNPLTAEVRVAFRTTSGP
ncbi:Ig-like domain-containing protein [Myxococcus sp. RHSTA-1-4]|uniref:Ig-like domain-containing protein n=1 Tax=Myxococcus sp. RHSTA-1-4 TaxID=2874601 RepID=UPI001CBE4C81|nr:Ig-like domain-containing protein [Myxococcus sp. RHSTA-1-4]